MKSIHRKLGSWAILALTASTWLPLAQAAPVVSVVPGTQTIHVGDPASVDIVVSGLTEALGGFSFTLGFSDIILTPTGYVVNPDNAMGALPLDLSQGFSAGSLDVFYVADDLANAGALAAAQGGSFRLATLSFLGAQNGLSPLNLSGMVFSNFTGGATIAGVSARSGSICVGGDCSVQIPEPPTMLLVATALAALAALATRRRPS